MSKHNWAHVSEARKWDGVYHPYFYRLYSKANFMTKKVSHSPIFFELIPSNGDVPEDSYDIVRHIDFLDLYLEYHGTSEGEDLS